MSKGYIKQLSSDVKRRHVRFNNRYGIAIAGDLYYAENMINLVNILQ